MTRIAIIGSQFMATTHAQAFRLMPDVEIAAVVARDLDRARETFRSIEPRAQIFASLAEALDLGVDAVDICVPTDLHSQFMIEAAAAGRHIFCEKPIALTLEDADLACRKIEESGVIAQIGHVLRFWPEYQKLEEILRSKTYGELRSISFQRQAGRLPGGSANWLNQEARSGGAAVDLHIHDVDMIGHLFGSPAAVSATGFRDECGWSAISALYRYDNLLVAAEGAWHYPEAWKFRMAFTAVFAEGCLKFDCRQDPALWVVDRAGETTSVDVERPSTGRSQSGLGNVSELGGYYNQLRHFIDCVQAGRQPVTATPRQAREALRVVLAELESARTGQTISL